MTLIPIDRVTKEPAASFKDRVTGDHAPIRPGQDVGLLTGVRSGIVAVDLDVRSDGRNGPATLAAFLNLPLASSPLAAILRALPPTPVVRTRSGGFHIYFRHPLGRAAPGAPKLDPTDPSYLAGYAGWVLKLPGVDLRADGNYIKAPPSEGYTWLWKCEPAPAPDWFLSLAKPRPRQKYIPSGISFNDPLTVAAARARTRATPGTIEGQGACSTPAFKLALDLTRGFQISAETALDLMVEWSEANCKPPWSVEELEHKINDALASQTVRDGYLLEESKVRLTDLGNSRRFVMHHSYDLKFAKGLGWHVWDGARFRADTQGIEVSRAKRTVEHIFEEAKACPDPDVQKAMQKWARDSQTRARIEAIPALAKSDRRICLAPDAFDRNPWALNVANGCFDLKIGQFRGHTHEDLATKLSPVQYSPGAYAPQWDAFLARVLPNVEVRDFVQRWVGYSLTGVVNEDALAFLYGSGANGKSVFLKIVSALLGDYAAKAPADLLTLTNGSKHPADMMTLKGARLAWCSEVDKKAVWDETRVKDLASSDTIKARHMHQDFVQWEPTHKLWIAGNHKPLVGGTDEGIWRRLRLIPFTVTIPENERDIWLTQKLYGEMPGILNWAIEGCRQWMTQGLGQPLAVREAVDEYRKDSDVIGSFLADECEFGRTHEVFASDLYVKFTTWALANGERIKISQKAIGHELKKRGFISCARDKGRTWIGLQIRPIGPPAEGGRIIQGPWQNKA